MSRGQSLYHLQQLDSEADAKKQPLAAVEAALGESETLRRARQAATQAQAQHQKCAAAQRDLELEIQGVADKMSGSEQRLYSGAVKNPKELADLQAEIAALHRRQHKLEDDLLEIMIEREEAESLQEEARRHLDQIETEWQTDQKNLQTEHAAIQEQLEALEQRRAALIPAIVPDDLSAYRSLRQRKGGLAVVKVSDEVCSACGVGVSPSVQWQLRQESVSYCNNCERILVRS
jgi:predicted  nucleic acid-binding Zn-ribbon protein